MPFRRDAANAREYFEKKKTFIKPRFPSFIALTHVEVLIVLYTDDAISTDTLNMRREVGTEIKRNRW